MPLKMFTFHLKKLNRRLLSVTDDLHFSTFLYANSLGEMSVSLNRFCYICTNLYDCAYHDITFTINKIRLL